MKRKRTIEEINAKIAAGTAVVMTAGEISSLKGKASPADIFDAVDVVTTGTFSPMCSSGAFLNLGQTEEHIKIKKATLNDVGTMSGLAAVDAYIGATTASCKDPKYGGAHVIEALIRGNKVILDAQGDVTDCYTNPRNERAISLDDINEAYMFNPRNCYQNYAAAVNSSGKKLKTYMGTLLPNGNNINYCTSGELSPLINDPELRTIGTGTRILLCGGTGYVAAKGTQFNTAADKNRKGIPFEGAATLALRGGLRDMSPAFIKAAYMPSYGVTLFVAVSIPISVLDTDMAARVLITNKEIDVNVRDFGISGHPVSGRYTYEELASGAVTHNGVRARTIPLSSLAIARKSAMLLKRLIMENSFHLTEAVEKYGGSPENTGPSPDAALTCALCGACAAFCPSKALFINGTRLYHDPLLCSDCGICGEICPCGLIKGGGHGGIHA